ncbi:MAG: hypothetical protein IPG60_14395 [Bacteroidetes bacterium]|nr:hypothetical protein [Bacteroidota bacterium]MBK8487084.1 hypothetical protein [Bacteroidota bacterium]
MIKQFYQYQKERFPVAILTLTTSSVLYSTYIVLAKPGALWQWSLLLISALSFLLHIRIIDENRDKDIDDAFHKDRPVQRGLISIKQLNTIGFINGSIFFLIHFYLDTLAGILSFMLLLYSLLGRYDFFMSAKFKTRFWGYNIINTFQLIALQLISYTVFVHPKLWTVQIFYHCAGVYFLSLLIEVGRKTFPISLESEANDSYSSRLGFKAAIGLCVALYLIATLSYFLSAQLYILPNILSVLLFVVISFKYINKQNVQMQKIYLVGIILLYVTLNFSFHAW